MAPLDLQVSLVWAYAEFANHNYPAVVATVQDVHSRKHKGAELVHSYASAAWEFQGNPLEAQHEIETLLQEDPHSASAYQLRQILRKIRGGKRGSIV